MDQTELEFRLDDLASTGTFGVLKLRVFELCKVTSTTHCVRLWSEYLC